MEANMTGPTLGGWLVHVMREADAALSLEEALHVILDSTKSFFPCQSVAVVLLDEDTKEPRIKISRQISYTFIKQYHPPTPPPAAEQVVLEQSPALFNDLNRGSEAYAQIKMEHDFSSAVLAPIIRTQRGVGYIFCDRANGERFDESDLLHLQVFGLLIGNLMERFDLLKQSRTLSQYDDASRALLFKAFVPAAVRELERARQHGYGIAFALLSVDAFRKYIDKHGIQKAHDLLAEVVRVIRAQIRDTDILARFAADEFVLCLAGTTPEEARATLEKARDAVRREVMGQGDAAASVTIGAITLTQEAHLKKPVQDLLAGLGRTLVQAKSVGAGHMTITQA
jgi:diguanylate cyclase (GGDEF)-like protein